MSGAESPSNAPAHSPLDAAAAKAARRARKVRWLSRVGYWAVQLLARTWRIDLRGEPNWPTQGGVRRPVVVAVWHGLMLAPIWTQRNRGIMALASEHGDGEIIARILERLGYAPPARGSSSRGGVRGLITMINALRGGTSLAFTPDGPRGPARVAQPGLFVAAHRASVPIVPMSMHAARVWRLKSWDRYAIPKPFARVCVTIGEPFVPQFDGDALAAGEAERFAAAMDATEAMARA
ncbi:MAG: lysophospholipid acyltransferase family protein [Gemmatimonadota bacterium]|nr:lysophospholipid acyltransferase family protein [Gemmatimonadota bacterium]